MRRSHPRWTSRSSCDASARCASICARPAVDRRRNWPRSVIAADYPFIDVLWTMIIFFFWVIWIWIVITVLIDVFRRHDIGGCAKALWVIFVVILPWLGVLVYLIVEHDGMRERSVKQRQAQQQAFDEYVRDAAGGLGRRDRQGQGAARLGRDHPGGVRRAQGEGARVERAGPRGPARGNPEGAVGGMSRGCIPHPSVEERAAGGKATRSNVPRSSPAIGSLHACAGRRRPCCWSRPRPAWRSWCQFGTGGCSRRPLRSSAARPP